MSVRTDQNKNKRQNVIGNSLLFHDKADFSVGQYGLHHRVAHRHLFISQSSDTDFYFGGPLSLVRSGQ